jgi:hypothetical protein
MAVSHQERFLQKYITGAPKSVEPVILKLHLKLLLGL